jgi:lactaldehyde dehydrogenase/glycolaldehyde dehydrogenase
VTVTEQTLFVGRDRLAGEGPPLDVVNPATEEVVASIGSASEAQVEEALATARAAFPAWSRLPAVRRGNYVRVLADLVERHRDELARLLVQEVGKPLAQAYGEVDWTMQYIRYTAEWDRRIEGDIVPSDNPDESIQLLRVPIGVVAAICPWNFPVALYFRKVSPALVTGNTVVLKPSEVTPLTSILLTELIGKELDLPAGVLNLVTGGRDTGRALVRSQSTDIVTMTGHRETGKAIMADAAANLTRVSLELGGKAPAIVWHDADIDRAVRELINARHTNTGQVCTCAERIFVHADVYDAFVAGYVEAAGKLRVGNPLEDVDLGPLVNRAQLEKATQAVAVAAGAGARVVAGGGAPQGAAFEKGWWLEPTVVTGVDPGMAIMREEVFGPVTPIMPVETLEQAFELANDSRYGLSAYIFTNDYRSAMRAANEIAFGEIYVNRSHGEAVQAHHIGHRESGLGGEDGLYGVLKYTQLRTVYHYFG